MKLIMTLVLVIFSANTLYSASHNCINLFFNSYQKTTQVSESISRHNLFGYTREWSTYRYSNGVKFFKLKIEGQIRKQTWTQDPSPYTRALDLITAYFGGVKLYSKQEYFIFYEQGSKELFKAYSNFISRPLKELEVPAQINKDNTAAQVQVYRKADPEYKVHKHKLSFYISSGMIFVKITELYKREAPKDFYLTLVERNASLSSLNQLIQVLYVFNGFKDTRNQTVKYLNSPEFDIARTHPLFHIQKSIKQQNSWLSKLSHHLSR